MNVIRRHEEKRRERERRQVTDKTDEHLRKKMSSTSLGVRDPRRILITKELEVETSVNIVEGQPGGKCLCCVDKFNECDTLYRGSTNTRWKNSD